MGRMWYYKYYKGVLIHVFHDRPLCGQQNIVLRGLMGGRHIGFHFVNLHRLTVENMVGFSIL